jgi:hypothetical protein
MPFTIIVQEQGETIRNRRMRVQTNLLQVAQTVRTVRMVMQTLEDLDERTERVFLDDEVLEDLPTVLEGLPIGQSVMVGIVSNGDIDDDGDLIATGTVRVQRAPDDALVAMRSPNSTVTVESPGYMFEMEYD